METLLGQKKVSQLVRCPDFGGKTFGAAKRVWYVSYVSCSSRLSFLYF